MATTLIAGFETRHQQAEALVLTGTVSVQNTTARNGGYAFQATAGASWAVFRHVLTSGSWRQVFQSARFYLYIATMPSVNAVIAEVTDSTDTTATNCGLRLNTDGTISLLYTGLVRATSTTALSTGQWYRLEWDVAWNTGGTGHRLALNGTEIATYSSDTPPVGYNLRLGCITSTVTIDVKFDDLVCYDGALGGYRTADYRTYLLVPTADSTIVTWTAGAGGTTNLYQALDNLPIVGATAPGTNASQIRTAGATPSPAYTATMQSYSAAGIGASDTVNAVIPLVVGGEEVGTATKNGTVELASNPAVAPGAVDFRYGDDAGACGTFPTNWRPGYGVAADAPSLTLATAPTVTLKRTDTGVRFSVACGLFLYADVTPSVATKAPPPFRRPWRVWTRAA